MANIFETKQAIDNREREWETTRDSLLYSFRNVHELWSTYRTVILPTLRKCCLLLHCQASQREITEQNSTKVFDMLYKALYRVSQ